MDIGTTKSDLLNAGWWFVVAALVLGYSYAVPKGLSVLAILARITAAGLVVMGLVVVFTYFVPRADARRGVTESPSDDR
jgi:uncharacterized sodium:solute symporter family permease YidK